jgi:hypothetical protein
MSQVAYGKAGQHQTKETHMNTEAQIADMEPPDAALTQGQIN